MTLRFLPFVVKLRYRVGGFLNLLTPKDIEVKLQNLMGWSYSLTQKNISKEFKFKDFVQAFAFMTQVGMYAEKKDHHPEWKNIYNKVWVDLSTHDAGGVTSKDIDLAAYMNEKAWEIR